MLVAARAQRTRAKLNSHQSIFSDGEKPSEGEREVSNTAWACECVRVCCSVCVRQCVVCICVCVYELRRVPGRVCVFESESRRVLSA